MHFNTEELFWLMFYFNFFIYVHLEDLSLFACTVCPELFKVILSS